MKKILINQFVEFFNYIFGNCWGLGHLILWCKETGLSSSFSVDEINKVPSLISGAVDNNQTMYFELGLQKNKCAQNKRGKEETVSVVPALCIDIDMQTPKRSSKKLPSTVDDALWFLHRIDPVPSITVWTGAGFQSYWVFDKPFEINTDFDFQEIKQTASTFAAKINRIASESGYEIDNVSALNHLMRIPGVPNYKYPGGISIIYENNNIKYDKDKFYDQAKDNKIRNKKDVSYQNKFNMNTPGSFNTAVNQYQPKTQEYITAINQYIYDFVLNISPPIKTYREPTPEEESKLLELFDDSLPDVEILTEAPPLDMKFPQFTSSVNPFSNPPVPAQVPISHPVIQEGDSLDNQMLYQLIESCQFLKHCRDDSMTLTEPQWYIMIKILVHVPNGEILIHELSKNYPKYTKSETDKYIKKSKKSPAGPVRCDNIKKYWDCQQDCGITTPVNIFKNLQWELSDENLSGDVVESQVLKQRIKPAPFPENIFPEKLKISLVNLSKSYSVENEICFCAALVVISSAIGTKVIVSAKKTYKTYVSLWLAVIANTGQKKTPVLSALTKILYDIQSELMIKHQQETDTYQQKLAAYEKNKQNNPNTTKPTPPDPCPTTITTDPTIEALILRLNESPNGILRLNDEIKVLIDGFDKYKGKKSGEAEIYLSMYNNTSIKVDRVDKCIFVEKPYLSVIGGVQPQKLQSSFKTGDFNDGFSARFLFYSKDDISRNLNRYDWTDEDAAVWKDLIKSIYHKKFHLEYNLCDEAWDEFTIFSKKMETLSRYSPVRFKGFPAKMETYLLRFAGILHTLRLFYEIETNADLISKDTMTTAIELANFFLYQASKMYEAYAPKQNHLDLDSKAILESITTLYDETQSNAIPTADINKRFNSIVDPSAVIEQTTVFGKYISNIFKELKLKYESKLIKAKKCIILNEKTISRIRHLLSEE